MQKITIATIVGISIFSSSINASPWIEADDPFVRSDLQSMVDNGLISTPTNTYPIRWSLFSDQFSQIDLQTLSSSEELAYRHIQYRLDSERLGRGRSHLTLSLANRVQAQGFGDDAHTKAGINASHEIMEDEFAFRIASSYRQADDKNDRWNFDTSYFAVASHDFSITAGWLDRWWGVGWQHTSGIGQKSYPIPSLSFSYLKPNLPVFGSAWMETFIAKQDNDANNDYLSASRIALRPNRFIQLGATWKSWFGSNTDEGWFNEWQKSITNDNETGLFSADIRLASKLPASGSGGIYGEWGKTKEAEHKYSVLGGDAQWMIGKQSVRHVLEFAKQSGSDDSPDYFYHSGQSIIDVPAESEISLGQYWQFSNDMQLSMFIHQTKISDYTKLHRLTAELRQQAFAGMMKYKLGFSDQETTDINRAVVNVSYEYRFN